MSEVVICGGCGQANTLPHGRQCEFCDASLEGASVVSMDPEQRMRSRPRVATAGDLRVGDPDMEIDTPLAGDRIDPGPVHPHGPVQMSELEVMERRWWQSEWFGGFSFGAFLGVALMALVDKL